LLLASRPVGNVKDTDFRLSQEPVPEPNDGEAVVQNLYISIDPTQRTWISGLTNYMPAVGIGTVVRAACAGRVVKSRADNLQVGTLVTGYLGGVQDYCCLPSFLLNPLPEGVPLNLSLSLFGLMGLTAWIGVNICERKKGDVLVVSGAAGAVGSIACQLAKHRGMKVFGIAGTKEKIDWLVNDVGIDGAINYKTENVEDAIVRLCPSGVDAYFDNVGGNILEAVMRKMNRFGRIAYSGHIDHYNNDSEFQISTYRLIQVKTLTIMGFLCIDHLSEIKACMDEIGGLFQAGKIKVREDIEDGDISAYPKALNKLFTGSNKGKLMMRIAE